MTARAAPVSPRSLPESGRFVLRCIHCGGHLLDEPGALRCVSTECGARFEVLDGVPVLLDGPPGGGTRHLGSRLDPPPRRLRAMRAVLPTLSRNVGAVANYQKVVALLPREPRPLVLVVGGRISGEGTHSLLDEPGLDIIESDITPGPRTNLLCDCHRLPFPDESMDCVVAQAVLEHVIDPYRCARECVRVLRPGGILYAETPFMQQVHAGPADFTRFTHSGHRRLFSELEELDSGIACGPGMALAWSYAAFLKSFGASRRSRRALDLFARTTAFWLPWFDRYLADRPGAIDAASAFYFLGKKSGLGVSDGDLLAYYRGGQR